MSRAKLILVALVAVSLAGNIYLYRQLSEKSAEVPYWSQHRPLIDKSIQLFAADRPIPLDVQTAMRNRFPIAAMVPDTRRAGEYLICVTLKLRRGMIGETPVYCFDDQGDVVSRSRV